MKKYVTQQSPGVKRMNADGGLKPVAKTLFKLLAIAIITKALLAPAVYCLATVFFLVKA